MRAPVFREVWVSRPPWWAWLLRPLLGKSWEGRERYLGKDGQPHMGGVVIRGFRIRGRWFVTGSRAEFWEG